MTDIDIATTRPGTPGGRFMRRFWIAVHRSEDLEAGKAKAIRIMSEDYTLYRGESGRAQVLDYRCPHRGAQMYLGWVEGDDIRCIYHGWKFAPSGQCNEQPAEGEGFARKVQMKSYPTREWMGLVYAYFGEGAAPEFPPYPAPKDDGVIDVWTPYYVPCNYLQSYENSADEVHVAFVHRPGGSHAPLAENLPEVSAEETDWGMMRYGRRAGGKVRNSLHYMPSVTRVIVPPLAGMDNVGGWPEIYFHWTPIDDQSHWWFITSLVRVTGREADAFMAKRAEFRKKVAEAPPVIDVVRDVWEGRRRLLDLDHPELAAVQDIVVQAGQGPVTDREHERLGRSDTALILWRKILARELRAIADGREPKRWTAPPADLLPTLGF
jgi:5,5'-dehydrodivanillate O-demethylase oxygenase subunit